MNFRINPQVVCWSKLEEETLVLSLDSGFYYTLDEIGGLIWEMLVSEQDRSQIVARLVQEYEVSDPQTVEKDVDELLSELMDEGLLESEEVG
jgi:hypothetical protein